jgi:hypothetical protein
MSFKFDNPNQEDKGNGRGKLKAGIYSFKVDQAEEKTSKAGNPMCALTLLVAAGDRDVKVFDRLVVKDNCVWKWKQFCKCIGIAFKDNLSPNDFINKMGMVELVEGEKGYLEVDKYCVADDKKGDGLPF